MVGLCCRTPGPTISLIPSGLDGAVSRISRTVGRPTERGHAAATHSWLNRNRGILIRWCKKDENHLALLQLASGLIAFKKAHAAQLAATQAG